MTVSGRMARASAYKSVPASAEMGMKTSSNGTAARARPRPRPFLRALRRGKLGEDGRSSWLTPAIVVRSTQGRTRRVYSAVNPPSTVRVVPVT